MYLGGKGAVPKKGTRQKAKEDVDRRSKGLKESVIQSQCENLLDSLGIVYLRIPDAIGRWVFGAGTKVPVHIRTLISSFVKGQPDLTILCKTGKYYCVELKTVTGKMSQGQKTFEKRVGIENFYLLRSVEALAELIAEKGIK